MREENRRNELVSMQEMQMAGHAGLVHRRVEQRTGCIIHIVRVARIDLDMSIGVGVARDIRVNREAYPYAALLPNSSAEAEHLSSFGVEPSSDIRSSV